VLQSVAVCCSVLQRVAVCCSVLQCVAYPLKLACSFMSANLFTPRFKPGLSLDEERPNNDKQKRTPTRTSTQPYIPDTHTHTHTRTHTRARTNARARARAHAHAYAHSLALSPSLFLSFCLPHNATHTPGDDEKEERPNDDRRDCVCVKLPLISHVYMSTLHHFTYSPTHIYVNISLTHIHTHINNS